VNAAAIMFLRGIDPVGVPFLAARDPLIREVWTAVLLRAGRLMEKT
jgi:hypothetical protein